MTTTSDLAARPELPGAATRAGAGQYLSYVVGGTEYAVPILRVREILQFDGLSEVPGVPPSIRGVVNVRGAVVPVVDLARRLGRGEVTISPRTCILIVEATTGDRAQTFGLMTDAVNEVVDLATAEIEAPPSFGVGVRLDHVTGMGKLGKRLLILLDLDRVLASAEGELAAATAAAEHPPEA